MGKIHIYGGETRFITKLFKKSGLHIAFTTKHNIDKLLTYSNNKRQNKYEGSGVYQSACLDCNKNYTGQTGSSFCTWFKEHVRDY
jgi:transposase-like protein